MSEEKPYVRIECTAEAWSEVMFDAFLLHVAKLAGGEPMTVDALMAAVTVAILARDPDHAEHDLCSRGVRAARELHERRVQAAREAGEAEPPPLLH